MLFVMAPSAVVFTSDLFGFAAFVHLGPFYLFGLLMSGISNSFTYLTLHREMRQAAKAVFFKSIGKHVTTTSGVSFII